MAGGITKDDEDAEGDAPASAKKTLRRALQWMKLCVFRRQVQSTAS